MESVRVLSGGVVTPNNHLLHFLNLAASALSKLAHCSALVESSEGSEVSLRDRGSVVRADECISVSGVANNSDLDGLLCDLVDGLALSLENLSVSLEEVTALHTGASGTSTNKHSDISVLKSNKRISSRHNAVHASVSTVIKLHDEALEDLLGLRKLNELKDDLLVRAEHPALSDKVAKEVADLTGGASDSDADGSLLEVLGNGREVSTEGLKSAYEDVVFHGFRTDDGALECQFAKTLRYNY